MAFPLSDEEHAAIKARIDGQVELVVSAAVRFDGCVLTVQRPGRHGDCLNWLHHHGLGRGTNHECGFITNRGRFVGREEAGRIVLDAQQGSPGGTPDNNPRMALYSEDMWNDWDVEPTAPISPEAVFGTAPEATTANAVGRRPKAVVHPSPIPVNKLKERSPMSDPYADALLALEDAVHRAAGRAEVSMTHDEIATVLRGLADGYERGDYRD